MDKKTGIKTAFAAATLFSVLTTSSYSIADETQTSNSISVAAKSEKNSCKYIPNTNQARCYGIVKKGMNDCATPKHSCSGMAKKNNDPQEWIALSKTICNKITGGSTKPPK